MTYNQYEEPVIPVEGEEVEGEELPPEAELQPPGPDRNAILAERAKELASRAQSAAEGSLYSIGGMLDAPTKEANGDDLSDLFKSPSMTDPDMETADLFDVSEEDVFGDGGEDMSDLLDVPDEDVMGDEPDASPRPRYALRRPAFRRYPPPPSSLRGLI